MAEDLLSADALHALCTRLGERLLARRQQLTLAESCTGGLIAKLVTDVAGSSAWFGTGFITYANEAKQRWLDVSPEVLAVHGAVSAETVRAMAEGALAKAPAHWAVAVSGIAGPTGGTADKPVGTVWIAWSGRSCATSASRFQFDGDRQAVRWRTAAAALAGLEDLLNAPA
jgi:nicotinamide-nucleotide amidase